MVRILRIMGGVAVTEGDKMRVVLVPPNVGSGGRSREAFLNPNKIKRVVKVKRNVDGRIDEGTYIEYDSDNSFYDPFDWKELPAGEVEETKLIVDPKWIRRCGKNTFKIYLVEVERWDSYCFDLRTVISIWQTNIHPIYGVMD